VGVVVAARPRIAHCEAALAVWTRAERAGDSQKKGLALPTPAASAVRQADNLEKAIAACQTARGHSAGVAATQVNLGFAYPKFIRGETTIW
jgi:hypothetical protein